MKNLSNVLIIHADGNSFNNPSLKCIIDLLLENNCNIDLRYPESHAPMPELKGIRYLPFGSNIWRLKYIIFNRLLSWPLIFIYVFMEKILIYNEYDLIIGVDRQGLIEASILSKLTKKPYIFISFEIMFESETSAKCKLLEIKASKAVSKWIVQDVVRADILANENHLQTFNRILLPLASAGSGVLNSDRLRDYLGIPENKKVAILIGSISTWAMTSQILISIADWPDDWVLIVHERYGRAKEELIDELDKLSGHIGYKLYITDSASDMVDDMSYIFSGIDVGLAFYEPDYKGPYTGNNLKYLGLASGKISTYLRYGVPVIINEIGLYAEQARKYRFGCVAKNPGQIANCLNEINSIKYKQNARQYFNSKLDFNLHKDTIMSNLLSFDNKDQV